MTRQRRSFLGLGALALAAAGGLAPAAFASDKEAVEAQGLVDKSRATFNDLLRDKDLPTLAPAFKKAKAVMIFPQVLKAGFFLGGSGGTGVLLVRDEKTGEWSYPAFYTMGSVSFGLQFGGSAAEVVMLINSQKALESLYSNKLKLGGDASVAAGPKGVGAGAAAASLTSADFITYAKAQGAFIGMSFEGSVLDVRDALNSAYYGKPVTPVDILVRRSVGNKGATSLRTTLKTASN